MRDQWFIWLAGTPCGVTTDWQLAHPWQLRAFPLPPPCSARLDRWMSERSSEHRPYDNSILKIIADRPDHILTSDGTGNRASLTTLFNYMSARQVTIPYNSATNATMLTLDMRTSLNRHSIDTCVEMPSCSLGQLKVGSSRPGIVVRRQRVPANQMNLDADTTPSLSHGRRIRRAMRRTRRPSG